MLVAHQCTHFCYTLKSDYFLQVRLYFSQIWLFSHKCDFVSQLWLYFLQVWLFLYYTVRTVYKLGCICRLHAIQRCVCVCYYGDVYLGVWTGRQKLVWQCRGVSWAGRCCPVTRTLFQAAEWPGPSCPPPLPGPQNRPPSAGLVENIDRSNPTTHHAHCNTQKHRHHHKWDPMSCFWA